MARHLGYTRVVEAPVRIEERSGSTISLKRAWRLLADTLGIFVRLSVRHAYDGLLQVRRGRSGHFGGPSGETRPPAAVSPMPA